MDDNIGWFNWGLLSKQVLSNNKTILNFTQHLLTFLNQI